MLAVESREWFDTLRRTPIEQAGSLAEDQRLIRQFLRGEAFGPITDRRDQGLLARELLGPGVVTTIPSVEPTRR
jgi:hypothetical protein